MKRRLFTVFLVFCLLIMSIPFSAGSSPDIIIVAINDTVPFSINEAAMPFYSSDRLYLPYTVFNNTALGVVPSYDSSSRILTLSTQTQKISFYLDEGIVKDSDGIESRIPAIIRLGIMFVPAEYCTNFFGIDISYLTSLGGYPVVRMKTGEEVYSDSLFIEKAENMIAYRISQYVPSDGEPVTPPAVDPNPGHPPADDPTLPPDTPIEDNPSDDPVQPPPPTPKYVYAICGATEPFLDRMDNSSYPACFLLTPEQIAQGVELVRHIIGCGYTFGMDLRGLEDPMAAFDETSDFLEENCYFRTALVLCDAPQREVLRENGLIAFSPVENEPEVGASLILFDPQDAFTELNRLLLKDAEVSYLRETSVIPYLATESQDPLPPENEEPPET